MMESIPAWLGLFMEGTWRLPPEINLWGIYLPSLVAVCLVAVILALVAVLALERLDWLYFIWHPPLFFLAMVIFNAAMLSLFFLPR